MVRIFLFFDFAASTFHTLFSMLMFFHVAVSASLTRAPVDSKHQDMTHHPIWICAQNSQKFFALGFIEIILYFVGY